jgi:glycerate kinase
MEMMTLMKCSCSLTPRIHARVRSINANVQQQWTREKRTVAVLGAAGGIGQPLGLLMKLNPLVSDLRLYDVNGAPGVSCDISHINTQAKVSIVDENMLLISHMLFKKIAKLLCLFNFIFL